MKIIVLQTAFIGDLIMSTPIFRALRETYPFAQIDVLTIPQSAIILKYNPHIDNVFVFDKKHGFFRKIFNFIKTIKIFRQQKYDISISIQNSLTSSLILLFSGIKRRIGYRRLKFATDRVVLPKGLHNRHRVLMLMKPLIDKEFLAETEIFLSEKELSRATEIIETCSDESRIKIGIAPGSVWETKKWRQEYFAELTHMLAQDKFDIFFFGSSAEKDLCQWIIDKSQNKRAYNYAGMLDLLESAALISKMDLLLCNDSSPLHIANAVGTDVFAFFGPTVKAFGCYPYRENDKMLEVELECRPCSKHGQYRCPLGHHNCMRLITPDYVYKLIIEKFSNTLADS